MSHPGKRSTIITLALILMLITAPVSTARAEEPLTLIRSILSFTYVEDLRQEVLVQPTIEKTLETLGDPYTNYMTMEQYKNLQDSLEDTTFTGVGIKIEKIGSGIEILNVIPTSPAEKSGLLKGDIITHVNNIDLSTKTTDEVVALMRGPENSIVELQIKRNSKLLTINVTRNTVIVPTIEDRLLGENTAYIKVDTFGDDTRSEFAKMVRKYNAAQVSNWIIDIRGNMGGYLTAAQDLAGYFIGGNPVSIIKERRGRAGAILALEQNQRIDGNVILLVDEYSASASELLAAALKDNKKALIIGKRTFGKGSVQSAFTLKDQGVLKVTIAHFNSPEGRTINNMGVLPHLTIKGTTTLDSAYLLLGQSQPGNDKQGFLNIRMFGHNYEVNLKQSLKKENTEAFKQLINGLPNDAIIMVGSSQGWDMSSKQALYQYIKEPTTPLFKDPKSSLSTKAINSLAEVNLIQGYPDGKFYPDQKITRSEMAAMLTKAMGFKLDVTTSSFADVDKKSWYFPFIASAQCANLVNGDAKTQFRPDQLVTREEAWVMAARALDYAMLELSPGQNTSLEPSDYKDLSQISSWALNDITTAVNIGVVKGDKQHRLNPKQYLTRGEAANLVYQVLKTSGQM